MNTKIIVGLVAAAVIAGGALLIPEVDSPAPADSENASACEKACGNYVAKCLTLVPNPTQIN